MSTILITTPTGHIGARVVEQLLADGTHTVRVLAREPARLTSTVRERTDVRVGALDAGPALAEALDGADVFFLLIPPPAPDVPDFHAWQYGVGDRAARAAADAGAPRTVFLSSSGAHRADLGPVSTLGEVERRLVEVVPDLTVLRPGYFFENTLKAVGTIAAQGTIYGPYDPDLAFPQIATRDIGDAAARRLLDAEWRGQHTAALHGPRDLSMRELAAEAGEALGRPVEYVQVPVDAVAAAMRDAGAGPSMVNGYETMMAGFAASRFEHPEPRTAETTTPTTFGAWARAALAPAVARVGEAAPAGTAA